MIQAAFLDPKFKKLAFNSYNTQKLEKAIEQLKKKKYVKSLQALCNSNEENLKRVITFKSESLIWKTFDEEYSQTIEKNPIAAGII